MFRVGRAAKGSVILFLMLLISCIGENAPLVVSTDIMRWQRAANFTILNQDTVSWRDLSLFVRYRPELLDVDSVVLRVVTTTPSERTLSEEVVVDLSGRREHYREDIVLLEVPYRENVVWRESGKYIMSIYPKKSFKGIDGVGLTTKFDKR